MVDIAQLVERWYVEPEVAGSIPVIHPIPFTNPGGGVFFFEGEEMNTMVNGTMIHPTVNEVKRWFEQQHVTITFTTESGSRYTLVRRPGIAVLVRDNTAQAWRGDKIKVVGGSVKLQDKDGNIGWETTGVVSFHVLSN